MKTITVLLLLACVPTSLLFSQQQMKTELKDVVPGVWNIIASGSSKIVGSALDGPAVFTQAHAQVLNDGALDISFISAHSASWNDTLYVEKKWYKNTYQGTVISGTDHLILVFANGVNLGDAILYANGLQRDQDYPKQKLYLTTTISAWVN